MILVLNSGSSSLKFRVFSHELDLWARGRIEEIGPDENSIFKITIESHEPHKGNQNFSSHKEALEFALGYLQSHGMADVEAIGHRVVHGGDRFIKEVLINKQVLAEIEECIPLAPLHNPANLSGIEAASNLYPSLPQVAVFDTSFHSKMPAVARTYAIAHELTSEGYKRYGFHGISHEFITRKLAGLLGKPVEQASLISAHLGNGASVCAVKNGRSVDTSMGYTPLEGLVMGTRCGDLDAGIIFALLESGKYEVAELNKILNKKSGLLGLSGVDNDMRAILEKVGDKNPQMAIDVYCYRLAKYIASYSILAGSEAPLVFTAGVGENAALIREKTIELLADLGYYIDKAKNDSREKDILISTESSKPVYVLATNEERLIAEKTLSLLK